MTKTSPKRISATGLQRQVGKVIRRVAKDGEHIIVERHGFAVIAIISLVDYEMLMQGQGLRRSQDGLEDTER